MGFRVVNSSSFTFETDLPPSTRNIHPSGVLHAFRSTPNAAGLPSREEHTFAWITNSIHIENAVNHLENYDFNRDHGIAFIPYSTKKNWLNRYPHAAPSIECTDYGQVLVYLNWRPYPNGLTDIGRDDGIDAAAVASVAVGRIGTDSANDNAKKDDTNDVAESKKRKRYKDRAHTNILQDASYLPDAERDELHIEIYKYLFWLQSKLAQLGENASSAATTKSTKSTKLSAEDDDENKINTTEIVLEERRKEMEQQLKEKKGVDVTKLKEVLETMELAFAIIPNIGLEAATATAAKNKQTDKDNSAVIEQEQKQETKSPSTLQKEGAPFLEEALSMSLQELVSAREMAGKPKRRSRAKILKKVNNPKRMHDHTAKDFDVMFEKLVAYKEEHGDCMVSTNYMEDQPLAHWVRGLRYRKAALLKKGIDVEVTPETLSLGEKIQAKSLTVERLERLNAIGFAWTVTGPKTAWEDRFQELMEYYDINGKWPAQSMGSLGMWVSKQRRAYARGDENYMKDRAPKLDEVGFEWTPRLD